MSDSSKNGHTTPLPATETLAAFDRERRVHDDLMIHGIGQRLLHISELSTFRPSFVWDIRRTSNDLHLYRSEANPKRPGYLRPGYKRIDCDPSRLHELLEGLASTPLPCWLPVKRNRGLDGTTTRVEFCHGLAVAAVSWWQEGPPEWAPFTQAVREATQQFKTWSESPPI